MAIQLAKIWKDSLKKYFATDLDFLIPEMRENIEKECLYDVVDASVLLWGNDPPQNEDGQPFDLVLMSEVLHWNGSDLFQPDTLEPLAETLSASLSSKTIAVLAYRQRWPERESAFFNLCKEKNLSYTKIDDKIVACHVP